MNREKPINNFSNKYSSILNQNVYGQLQQQPSIEFEVQFPTKSKTQEQKSKNGQQIEEKQSKSANSLSQIYFKEAKFIPKSINHNFQKHTVVTIKKLTQNMILAPGNSPIQLIAQQMWNIFISSGIKSKRILVILFGRANLKDQRYQQLLKNCFFGQLCNHDEQAVRSAQNLLRQRVLESLQGERVKQNIARNRHIHLREQFYAYFMELVEHLKHGPLVKFRINSSTSKRIAERIKTNAGLQPSLANRSGKIRRNISKSKCYKLS